MRRHLAGAEQVLVADEVETFLESHVLALYARHARELGPKTFHGRISGPLPSTGELSLDLLVSAMAQIVGHRRPLRPAEYVNRARRAVRKLVPAWQVGLCAGCPHRATYWAVKQALALDGRRAWCWGTSAATHWALGPRASTSWTPNRWFRRSP